MYFLDTGFIKDLLDEKDAHHDAAVRINNFVEENNIKVMINTTVCVETLNRAFKIKFSIDELFDNLYDDEKLILLTPQDYEESLKISQWLEHSINFNDCTIVNTMFKEGIANIVTFDRDFKKIAYLNIIDDV